MSNVQAASNVLRTKGWKVEGESRLKAKQSRGQVGTAGYSRIKCCAFGFLSGFSRAHNLRGAGLTQGEGPLPALIRKQR